MIADRIDPILMIGTLSASGWMGDPPDRAIDPIGLLDLGSDPRSLDGNHNPSDWEPADGLGSFHRVAKQRDNQKIHRRGLFCCQRDLTSCDCLHPDR
jgi:hypothetical protein